MSFEKINLSKKMRYLTKYKHLVKENQISIFKKMTIDHEQEIELSAELSTLNIKELKYVQVLEYYN